MTFQLIKEIGQNFLDVAWTERRIKEFLKIRQNKKDRMRRQLALVNGFVGANPATICLFGPLFAQK